MDRDVDKWLAAGLVALLGLFVAANLAGARYLRPKIRQHLADIEDVRRRESAYRRPFVSGQPLEQDAAEWYRRAFSRHRVPPGDEKRLYEAADAGVGRRAAAGGPQRGDCAGTTGGDLRTALRSTRCDWNLGFGIEEFNEFDQGREAMTLASCLTLEGHQAARDGDRTMAAQSYLEAVAVGSDLGMGNDVMCLVGVAATRVGLISIGRLVADVDDPAFLDDAAQRVVRFKGHLPDCRLATRRSLAWIENAISLDGLANKDRRLGALVRIFTRPVGAWRLSRDEAILRDLRSASAIADRDEAAKLIEALKRDTERSRNQIVRTADLAGVTSAAVYSTFQTIDAYRAAYTAILLQQWHVEHRQYPRDASLISAPAGLWDLKYEVTGDGRGYKLSNPYATILEVPVR